MSTRIRHANRSDAARLCELRWIANLEEGGGTRNHEAFVADFMTWANRALGQPPWKVWIAERDGVPTVTFICK